MLKELGVRICWIILILWRVWRRSLWYKCFVTVCCLYHLLWRWKRHFTPKCCVDLLCWICSYL